MQVRFASEFRIKPPQEGRDPLRTPALNAELGGGNPLPEIGTLEATREQGKHPYQVGLGKLDELMIKGRKTYLQQVRAILSLFDDLDDTVEAFLKKLGIDYEKGPAAREALIEHHAAKAANLREGARRPEPDEAGKAREREEIEKRVDAFLAELPPPQRGFLPRWLRW